MESCWKIFAVAPSSGANVQSSSGAELGDLGRCRPSLLVVARHEHHHLEDGLVGIVAVGSESVEQRVEHTPWRQIRKHRVVDRVDQFGVAELLRVDVVPVSLGGDRALLGGNRRADVGIGGLTGQRARVGERQIEDVGRRRTANPHAEVRVGLCEVAAQPGAVVIEHALVAVEVEHLHLPELDSFVDVPIHRMAVARELFAICESLVVRHVGEMRALDTLR